STSGSITSRTTTSGRSRATTASASAPLAACVTWQPPTRLRNIAYISRSSGASSTMRIRGGGEADTGVGARLMAYLEGAPAGDCRNRTSAHGGGGYSTRPARPEDDDLRMPGRRERYRVPARPTDAPRGCCGAVLEWP